MITIDYKRAEVILDGKEISFSPIELKIIDALQESQGVVMSREEIAAVVRPEAALAGAYETRTIDQHIARIRRKLGPKRRNIIKTIPTRGYKFNARG